VTVATQAATLWARPEALYIEALAQTEAGFWISHRALPPAAREASDHELGELIATALDSSVHGVPTPDRQDRTLTQDLLQSAGLRSWRSFAKDAHCVQIDRSDDKFTVTAWRRMIGRVDAFEPTDRSWTLDDGSPETLGSAVRSALDSISGNDVF
jgi:hypothetical protein